MRTLGCDPGVSGALVLIDWDEKTIEVHDMPTLTIDGKTRIDHHALSNIVLELKPIHMATIEHVHAMPKQGVSSSFNFGASYGALLQAMASACVPYHLVSPATWCRVMGVSAKEADSSRKQASMLLPEFSQHWKLKKHHGRSDAALLAAYGKQTLERMLK